jgi:uncharacterized damage-inducible protein DinB
MKTIQLFSKLSDYNHWMNRKLFAVCEPIPDAVRKRNMHAFFGSVHGTLNHLLLADRLWMSRFQQTSFTFRSLDQELYSSFSELQHEREKTDQEISDWISSLDESELERSMSFVAVVTQKSHRFKMADALFHFFNHQTHHRGQLTTLLNQLGYDFGVTDFMWMPGIELP